MAGISFSGNYYLKGATATGGVNSLITPLGEKGFIAPDDDNNILFLTGQEEKDRKDLFKAAKEIYRASSDDEIDAKINQAFIQNAIQIDLKTLLKWPRA